MYGGFLYLHTCTAVSEYYRKWKFEWQSKYDIYIHLAMSYSAVRGMFVDVMPLFNHG